MMANIFLSGAKGFIGKNISEALRVEGPSHTELELTDTQKVDDYFAAKKFDCIIHGANIGGTRNKQYPEGYCLNKNLRMFTNVFKQINGIKRFIQLGSGAEYGRPLNTPQIEEDALGNKIPEDDYGFSKLLCSTLIKTQLPEKAVTLHLFGVFGPHEDVDIRFISYAIKQTLLGNPIIINQNVKFDYLYINDFIHILKEFIQRPAVFSNYNIGRGEPVTLVEIAEVVREVLGVKNEITIKMPGMGHEYTCNNTRMREFLGDNFTFTPLTDAVKMLASWHEKNS